MTQANGWGAVGVEETNNGGAGKKMELDFLKLPYGDTKVRILDESPHIYKEWWATQGNGGQGCSIPYFKTGDLLNQANQDFMDKIFKEADAKGLKDKARKDFLRDFGYKKTPFGKVKDKNIIHVLDRSDGTIKLLDSGNGIFNAIKAFALNAEYGDPRNYDITITKTDTKGNGDFQDIKYSVTPARNNIPLTAEETALYNEKKIDLAAYKAADMTPEQALMIAKGQTFKEVLGNGSDSPEAVQEKSSPDMLPADEPAKEEAPRKDEPVNVDKGEALSPEELANISFE